MFHFRCYILKGSPFNVKLYKRPKHDINFFFPNNKSSISYQIENRCRLSGFGAHLLGKIEPNFDLISSTLE